MASFEEEFEASGQEKHRLSIAIQRFTEVSDSSWKEKYVRYLSLRFRPAMNELIQKGDLFRIRSLCRFAPITEASLDSFIAEAVACRQDEIAAFFMEFKREHFGFHDRDFTL